jgi:O-antigen/teichoic acid export membrane protein
MPKFISELQKKPDNYKRKLSFFISIGFTLIIVTLWLITLFSGGIKIEESDISIDDASAPMESLKASALATFDSIKDLIEW